METRRCPLFVRFSLGLFMLIATGLIGCTVATSTAVPPSAVTALPLVAETQDPIAVTLEATAAASPLPVASATTVAGPTEPRATATIAVPIPTIPANVLLEAPEADLLPGFSMLKFADLYRPTSLAFGPNGALYATSFDGTVHRFRDSDNDGRADEDLVFAFGFDTPLGVEVSPDGTDIFVSSKSRITRLRDSNSDGVADQVEPFATGLPVGRHQNDNLKFGPDGFLYMGIGSTCDACDEADPRSATIMRFDPESGTGEVYATGLRNPYDLAFHPETGELFATDNGRDDLGMESPYEELNEIVRGADYGWPGCWDRFEGPACGGTRQAVALFPAHSSANSLDFYGSGSFLYSFPNAYTNNLFVAIFGSWLKAGVETGIARVVLSPTENGYETTVSWFARWEGMPLGLIVGPDGALYVGDYTNGAIYRISYGLP